MKNKEIDYSTFYDLQYLLNEEFCRVEFKYSRAKGCMCNSCFEYTITVYDVDDNFISVREDTLYDALKKLADVKNKINDSGIFPEELRENK